MAGRPSKLTPEVVAKAREIAADGLPVDLIAEHIGVHRATCSRWIREADEREDGSLQQQFRSAIFLADAEYCRSLMVGLKTCAANGNPWAATWLLTHHPRLRDHFSDAAAERRTVAAAMAPVIKAIGTLPPEQRQNLILAIQAEGGSLPEVDDEPGC